MKKIRLLIEYDGTAYHGWQIQKDLNTIQGILEESVQKITGKYSKVIGSSRTDAGVHALGQVATFATESNLDNEIIVRALNAILPQDIRILDVSEADDYFHARDSALKKSYFYIIANHRKTSAFIYRYAWVVPQHLKLGPMKKAADILKGIHDFTSFMGTGSDIKNTVREIYSLDISAIKKINFMSFGLKGNFIKIRIEANGFLRDMVRNIVGTLVEIGRGRMSPESVRKIIESKDRRLAGQTAPANGLFLERIDY